MVIEAYAKQALQNESLNIAPVAYVVDLWNEMLWSERTFEVIAILEFFSQYRRTIYIIMQSNWGSELNTAVNNRAPFVVLLTYLQHWTRSIGVLKNFNLKKYSFQSTNCGNFIPVAHQLSTVRFQTLWPSLKR